MNRASLDRILSNSTAPPFLQGTESLERCIIDLCTKLSFLSVKNTFKKACSLEILGSSKKFVGRNIFSVKSFVSSPHFYHFSSISSMRKKCPYS